MALLFVLEAGGCRVFSSNQLPMRLCIHFTVFPPGTIIWRPEELNAFWMIFPVFAADVSFKTFDQRPGTSKTFIRGNG